MEFHLLRIFSILSVAVVACHAALSPEAYWKYVLPNTPMPGSVKDSLPTAEWGENKGTAVGVGKGGVIVGGDYHGKPVYVGVTPSADPFNYLYAATEDQLHGDPNNVALFFKKSELQQQGNEMKMHFTKTGNAATFLRRSAAGKIPFSTVEIPRILSRFSISPDSKEARAMKKTLKECEAPAMKGEEKLCATSLESMVDFTISQLGKNVKAISTEAERKSPVQKYTISGSKKMGKDDKAVVCHKQSYAYAVFYCHKTQTTEVYEVSLVGFDGTKVKAAAVCHKDTSGWNPNHLAFQVLKVKPGTVPVCHFLPEDHIVWVN